MSLAILEPTGQKAIGIRSNIFLFSDPIRCCKEQKVYETMLYKKQECFSLTLHDFL